MTADNPPYDERDLLARWREEKQARTDAEADRNLLIEIVLACPRCAGRWAEEWIK